MLVFLFGGSGSGKSAYAEQLAVRLADGAALYYLATMRSCDAECEQRIERHRQQRQGRGFRTVEQSMDVAHCEMEQPGTVLLECLSTLLSNECYRPDGLPDPRQKIWNDLQQLQQRCVNLVVVSSDVFADGVCYEQETRQYIETLGWLHQQLARQADLVVEVVAGLPLVQKGVLV